MQRHVAILTLFQLVAVGALGGCPRSVYSLGIGGCRYMVTLNRSAIVVAPKQPFLDWLHTVDPSSVDLRLPELTQDPTIYLIPECDRDEDVSEILRDLCGAIFEEQLAAWYTDESVWPRDRGFNAFRRWFDYQHHSMLIDLSDESLLRESDSLP